MLLGPSENTGQTPPKTRTRWNQIPNINDVLVFLACCSILWSETSNQPNRPSSNSPDWIQISPGSDWIPTPPHGHGMESQQLSSNLTESKNCHRCLVSLHITKPLFIEQKAVETLTSVSNPYEKQNTWLLVTFNYHSIMHFLGITVIEI